jgi:hypothetical protein
VSIRAAVLALAARLGIRARAACGCCACDKTEREAREAIGMPARHPERITAELPEDQEEQLAALAAELWPDDDYVQIITETRQEGQQ